MLTDFRIAVDVQLLKVESRSSETRTKTNVGLCEVPRGPYIDQQLQAH